MGRLVEHLCLGFLENQKTKETSNIKGLSHQAPGDSLFVWVVFVVVFSSEKHYCLLRNGYQIKMVKKISQLLDSKDHPSSVMKSPQQWPFTTRKLLYITDTKVRNHRQKASAWSQVLRKYFQIPILCL